MSVIQNADLIDARLAMLAEGSLDGDDALNEQAFIEECQLIIAKGAFPASAGSQVQARVPVPQGPDRCHSAPHGFTE